jgi:hypothetical protein
MFEVLGPNDDEKREKFRGMMLPMIDQGIRSAIGSIWMALPPARQNVDEVQRQLQWLVDRAIADLREDASAFGLPDDQA